MRSGSTAHGRSVASGSSPSKFIGLRRSPSRPLPSPLVTTADASAPVANAPHLILMATATAWPCLLLRKHVFATRTESKFQARHLAELDKCGGIFADVLTQDIVDASFIAKYLYCLWWGLKNLRKILFPTRIAVFVEAVRFANSWSFSLFYSGLSHLNLKTNGLHLFYYLFRSFISRVKPSSSVSQSVGVLDPSANDKSAKPPRRLSIPTKSTFSPHQASVGSITPISETRLNRSNIQGKSDTPLSETSRSASRHKFCVLSSVSYWLTQIKLSESASKHSISLGFFKLAQEAGCEPLHRIREELKSYVRKHNLLVELEEPAKDLLQSYNILEDFEQLKLSENSPLSQEETFTSNQDVCSSSAPTGAGNLKPKSLISSALTVAEADKKENVEKRVSASEERASIVKNPRHPVAVKDVNVNNTQKKSQKPRRVESKSGNAKVKSSIKESVRKEADPVPAGEVTSEDKDIVDNKENMDSQSMDGAMLKEEIETS